MLDLEKIDAGALGDVRQRIGASGPNDDARDSMIQAMSPEEFFSEYCNWHGLRGWGPGLVDLLDEIRAAHIEGS